MSKDNGGPAFPTHEYHGDDTRPIGGMTLRDYFAAKAMPVVYGRVMTILDTSELGNAVTEGIAINAYEIADTMLKARSKS